MGVEVDPISQMGGSNRFITFLTMVIHFVHPLLCISNYLDWVRNQGGNGSLGDKLVAVYLAMAIIAALFYLLVASVFYMWAWRYPEPEEIAKRRRIYGVIVNLIFSDFPMFLVEVSIVWIVGFATGLQATSFLFTCLSMSYSGFRVWTFVMVKVIKTYAPPAGVMAGTGAGTAFSPRAFDPSGGMYGNAPGSGYDLSRGLSVGAQMGLGGPRFQPGPAGPAMNQSGQSMHTAAADSFSSVAPGGRVGGIIPGPGSQRSIYQTPQAVGPGIYRDPSPG